MARAVCADPAGRYCARCCAGSRPGVQPRRAALDLPGLPGPIAAWQNIPVLSWLVLRGRCAYCGAASRAAIRWWKPSPDVLTAAVAWQFGFGWAALAALVLTWFLIALTFIDLDHQLLPDA